METKPKAKRPKSPKVTLTDMEPMARLTMDVRESARALTTPQARYLVDFYYQLQGYRIRAEGQGRAQTESGEPHYLVAWMENNTGTLERDILHALEEYSSSKEPGRWAKSICGIGPVLASGLLAHIDIRRAPTVGHIWRYAGLDPTQHWIGKDKAAAGVRLAQAQKKTVEDAVSALAAQIGVKPENLRSIASTDRNGQPQTLTWKTLADAAARRPWNARLKVLTWKIGESFVKVSNNENDVYGHIYQERKALEESRNAAGDFADQAKYALETKDYNRETNAKTAYNAGTLPPGHIHARAKRYAVKLFLAHYHHVAYECEFGTPPPKPYVIEHGGHTHYQGPPNWPMQG